MLDVVPSGVPSASRGARRRRHVSPQGKSSRVVTMNWRLPARLRRPIRQELAKARQQRRRRQAIVSFERRPLYSQVPNSYPTYRPSKKAKYEIAGAEQHTGDVYRHSRPDLAVTLPPYYGGHRQAPSINIQPKKTASQPTLRQNLEQRRANALPRMKAPAMPTLASLGNQVRDVPYRFAASSSHQAAPMTTLSVTQAEQVLNPIAKPKRRFALPLHFSIFPWRKSVGAVKTPISKKKI